MTNFTYSPPKSADFIYTLKQYLQTINREEISVLLTNCNCEFPQHDYLPDREYNTYDAIVRFFVPVVYISKFTASIQDELLEAVKVVFPKNVGFEILGLEISPIIKAPPDDEQRLSNSASLGSSETRNHDGLKFRSQSEIQVYEALKKRNVLFFANATAVLGGTNWKKEPDFLVCQDGKWGILEVMGDDFHPPETAMKDHDRGRLFNDYGVSCIHFYDAPKCYNTPEEVVDDFLSRLSKL